MPINKDGWTTDIRYRPYPYDLVLLLLEDGNIKPGWWGTNRWEGRRINENSKVKAWKIQRTIISHGIEKIKFDQ